MSKAEELLYSLDNAGSVARLVDMSTEPHIVIDDARNVTVPDELKRLAVQYDHDIETVTFDCPRYWDKHDMSEMAIYINYLRPDNETGTFKATNVVVDDDDSEIMHFDWTISRNATAVNGQLVFIVCIRKNDEDGNEQNHWNSELCKACYVSEGLEMDSESFTEIIPDVIEQWYKEVVEVKNELFKLRDSGEFDGATFTPSVNSDGDLSWTNDKGRENPPTVNTRGVPGISPTIETTDIQGGHRVTITDINGTQHFDVFDTIVDDTEAVTRLLTDFVYVGPVEPTSGPVLWFDTSLSTE